MAKTIPEQLAEAPVTEAFTSAPSEAAWPKLGWANTRGTFTSERWKPPGYNMWSPTHSYGGIYYAEGKLEGGNAFVALENPAYTGGLLGETVYGAEYRSFSVWLFCSGTGSANGYQLRLKQYSNGTGTPHEYKFMLIKWVEGAETVLYEGEPVTMENGGAFALAAAGGKLTMYLRETEGAEWKETGVAVEDETFTEGYSGIDGTGSNPYLDNFVTGTLEVEEEIEVEPEVSGRRVWTMILTDLEGNELNEVRQATDRKVIMSLNKPSTAAFTVRPDNPILADLFAEDTLLKVYEAKSLRFHGNVVSSELSTQEDGSQPTVKVNAADPAWRLSRRVLGQSSGGTKFTGDKAKSAYKMINELNTAGNTGVKLLAEAEYDSEGEGEYIAGPYKAALSCINDLAHGFDGFDWYMEPIEYSAGKIVTFQAAGVYGGSAAAVFEHGFGQHNVRKLSYLRDLSGLANVAFHLPDEGFTEGAEVKKAEDATSIAARGRFEAVADGFGLTDATLRQNWVDEVVRVRKNPRFVVSTTLDVQDDTGRVPQIKTDFWLGDLVHARSVINGLTMFEGQVRVYQIQVEINDNGTGTVTPVLIDEEGSEL